MALPLSGPLSLNQIHVEAGGTSGTSCSLNEADTRSLIDKAVSTQNAISEYYGASSQVALTSSSTINGQDQRLQIVASDYISSGGTLNIPSTMWVWSDDTSIAALTIDIPCTIVNDGKIIGKGGAGGSYSANVIAGAGGPAINVTSSGVTITNSSGAYIAGGGGGGGATSDYSNPSDAHSGGGGGAGGGVGGRGRINSGQYQEGPGGVLNASGGHGGTNSAVNNGGGAGGGGGSGNYGGGGGGRILPGVGGNVGGHVGSGSSADGPGGGGSAGNAAPSAGSAVWSASGGGGGWGAAGGLGGGRYAGGAGGSAITGTSRTLNNNGTIYGATT